MTNYDTMRQRYAQRGVRFYTHNDSEIIGIYLAERLSRGNTLGEALQASVADFDGSYSYLAATSQALGFAKDPFALKPLLVTETETFVALATEEMAMRGGTVVIHGDAAARAGVSMKGGTLLIAGNCGYMAGFMGQKGTLIVCGDTGEAFADSRYETVWFVGGRMAELGNDAIMAEPTAEDATLLATTLARYLKAPLPDPASFKKVVAGRKLWNFDQREWTIWREAL